MGSWEEYQPTGEDYISPEQWGQDHWSTFVYLETCAVDNKGKVNNLKMRCDARLHRHFAHDVSLFVGGDKYPTKLKEGERTKHDDWSCLEDMAAAGFLRAFFRQRYSSRIFGDMEARIELTPTGVALASRLRQHRAQGGTWQTFAY